MNRYSYNGNPLSRVLEASNSASLSGYSPAITYRLPNNSSGYDTRQFIPYRRLGHTADLSGVPFSYVEYGNTGWGYEEYNSDETNYPTGTTNAAVVSGLNTFVRDYNYTKLRCILVGAGGSGGGGGASNNRPAGAGGGSGAFAMFDLNLTAASPNSTLTLSVGGAANGGVGSSRSSGGGRPGAAGGSTSLTYYSGNSGNTSNVSANGGAAGGGAGGLGGGGGTVSQSGLYINMVLNRSGRAGANASYEASYYNPPGGPGPLSIVDYDRNYIGNENILTFQNYLQTYQPKKQMTTWDYNNYADLTSAGGLGGMGGLIHSNDYGWGGGPGSRGYARIYFIT